MKKNLLTYLAVLLAMWFNPLNAQPFSPSVQASNVQISYKYTSGAAVTLTWTRGNGGNCMVVLKKTSSSYSGPPSSTTANYTASGSYGSGSSLGNGDNYVVYDGTGTSVYVYNLVPNTYYVAYVYEYNQYTVFNTTYYYNTNTSGAYCYFYTLDTYPGGCGSITSASSITNSSATLNFTSGGGDGRLVTICPNGNSATPSSGYYYAPSSTYMAGATVGSGHAVYGSTGTNVNVTGLTGATTYKAFLYEYDNGTYPTYGAYSINTRNYRSCTSYTFNTTNIAPTLDAITNYTVCQDASWTLVNLSNITDGSTNENQSLSISYSSGNQTLIPNGNLYLSYNSPNNYGYFYFYPAAGQYGTTTITLTVNDGWSVNNTIIRVFSVTVLPKPGPAGSISGNSPICAGLTNQSYSIAATSNTNGYNWSVPSGFTVTAGAGTNMITVATTTATTSGNISVVPTNTNGCGSGSANTLMVQVDKQPAVADAGPDQLTVCGGSAVLNATAVSNPDAGVWSWLSGTPVPSIGTTTVNSTSITGLSGPTNTYKYVWTVTSAGSICPAKADTVTIATDWNNVVCQPAADFAYSPTSDVSTTKVCVGATVNFTDLSVSANTWNWDFEYAGGAPIFTSTIQNPSYTYGTVGTYSVYLRIHSNATGQNYNTVKVITVIDAPVAPSTVFGTTNGICEGSANQYVYSIGSVTDATSYNWTTPLNSHIDAYPSPTSIALSYPKGAVSGTIAVSAQNSCGTSATSTLAVTVNPLPSSAGNLMSGPATVCQGQNASYSIGGYANATSYTWSDLTGAQTTGASNMLNTTINNNATNGTISVWGNNACGSGDTVTIALTVNPLPGAASPISGPATMNLCGDTADVTFVVPAIANATTYNWGVPAGTSIIGGNGADTIVLHVSSAVIGGANQITVYGSNACGAGSSGQGSIMINTPEASQICMVTVDDSSTHNVIYWDKTAIMHADSFRIYREDVTNVYHRIGAVSYNSLSEFHDYDPAANPNTTTKRYKITSVDSCGNESAMSPYHNTIYITANGLGQFSWIDLYTIENGANPVTNYVLMVDSTNTGNWVQIASTSGNMHVINDIHYANYANTANWRVETIWGITCTSTFRMAGPNAAQGVVVKSKSNISNNRQIGIKNNSESQCVIYPNPSNGIFTLTFAGQGKSVVKVFSTLGQEVYNEAVSGNHCQVDLSGYDNGAYTVQIVNSNGVTTKRVVKQ